MPVFDFSSEYFAFLVVLYYSDSVRSIVCTDVVLFGAVCSVCCCFVLCVVVASRVSCYRRGGGPISCCGMKTQSVVRGTESQIFPELRAMATE